MVTVNVTDFRANMQQYISEAEKGERIQLTSRGRVVAQLVPPDASRDAVEQARHLLRHAVVSDEMDPSAPAVDPGSWNINK